MIQLAWRFVAFQKDSALIVALARKLLIAIWHLVRRPASRTVKGDH
jgi:hypothetical protein